MSASDYAAYSARMYALLVHNKQAALRLPPRRGAAHQGFVFLLAHPNTPGLLRVGLTSVSEFEHTISREQTSYPQPLHPRKPVPVFMNLKDAERRVFGAILEFRDHEHRGFFRLSLRQATGLIKRVLYECEVKKENTVLVTT